MVPCQAMSSHVCVVPRLLDGIAQLLFRVFARPVLVMEEPDRLCDLIRFMFLNSLYARLPATLSGLPGWCGTYKELWTALASEATRSRSPWSRCAVPGTHPRCPMEVLTHLDTLLFGRLFGRHVLICFDMLSRCCPHVVHMLTVRVGRLLFSFESSHGKRRAKVLAFTALRNCAASGFPLVWGLMVCCHDTIQHQTGLVPVNCFKQCLVSRQKKKPGLYEAEYLWTWQTEKNRTLSISFVFRRFQCAIETHRSAFCILKVVVQVSLCFCRGRLPTYYGPMEQKSRGLGLTDHLRLKWRWIMIFGFWSHICDLSFW